jgi:hypothetical protein
MFKKLSRQYCLEQYPWFPQSDREKEKYFFPKIYTSYTLTLPVTSLRTFPKNLAGEIARLAQNMNAGSIIFLGDCAIPWLHRQHDYKPARTAQQYLSEKKVGKKFCGGFDISGNELPAFLAHLFWLVRCNAVFPYVHFTDQDRQFIASLCQYGNLHFHTIDKKTGNLFKKTLKNSSLNFLKGNCFDQFSKTGKIRGRQITL